jgi:PQQ-like domain
VLIGTKDGMVFGLQADTGEVRWNFKTAGQITGSPIVAGDTMYVVSHDGTLYAPRAADVLAPATPPQPPLRNASACARGWSSPIAFVAVSPWRRAGAARCSSYLPSRPAGPRRQGGGVGLRLCRPGGPQGVHADGAGKRAFKIPVLFPIPVTDAC